MIIVTVTMECRIILGVCIVSALCLQIAESQRKPAPLTRRVTNLCSTLQGLPRGKGIKISIPNDYFDDPPTGPGKKTPKLADPNYDYYPDDYADPLTGAGPGRPGPGKKTPKLADPNYDYYPDDYADPLTGAGPGPSRLGPGKKTPKLADPNYDENYPDDYADPLTGVGPGPSRPGPGNKNPKLSPPEYDEYGDLIPPRTGPKGNPLAPVDDYNYDEYALGVGEDPDAPTGRGSPNSPKKKVPPGGITFNVICGGKPARRAQP